MLHLAGWTMGGHLAGTWLEPGGVTALNLPGTLTRMSGLLPLLGVILPVRWRIWTWVAVLLAALLAGGVEEVQRRGRSAVSLAYPGGPSQWREWGGAAVLRVTSWPVAREDDRWQAAAVVSWFRDEAPPSEPGAPGPGEGVLVSGRSRPPLPGQLLAGRAVFRVPRPGDLPGNFDDRLYLAGRHLRWRAYLDRDVPPRIVEDRISAGTGLLSGMRSRLLDTLVLLLPPPEAALASAVLLGERTAAGRESARPFAAVGLAHLFAVSGLHVGILLGLVVLPGKVLGWGRWGAFLPLAFLLPVYAALTGLPGSVVRAAGLGLLAGGAGILGRRANALHILGLMFWLTTMWEPSQVLDTGVRLSYLAAAGIVATLTPLRALKIRGPRSWLVLSVSVSLAAQWFTLPQAAASFGQLSLLATVANLVAVPVFGTAVWLVVLAVAGYSLWPWLGQVLAAVAWLVLRVLGGLVAAVDGRTGGLNLGLAPTGPWLGLAWGSLSILLLIVLTRLGDGRLKSLPGAAVLSLVLAAGFGTFAAGGRQLLQGEGVVVWQFDVGQGDCSLIQFPDGWRALVDTGGVYGFGPSVRSGPLERQVAPFLARAWVREIDLVLLTHGHRDHTGGGAALARRMAVRRWLTGGRAHHEAATWKPQGRVCPVSGPASLHRYGPWSLEILLPEGGYPEGFTENDRSLVTVLRHEGRPCMVWSGDLEQRGENHLLTTGLVHGPVQVWKAGHHGSKTSGGSTWLEKLDPDLVLISCGTGNRYGHPDHGPYLSGGDSCTVLRTDLHGSVELRWDVSGALRWKTRVSRGQIPGLP